jgi:putative ABC transport system permease protein
MNLAFDWMRFGKYNSMFKTYIRTAIRQLARHRINSIVNISGLIVGFTAFLLIFLVVNYENSFDNFHPNGKNIYRVVRAGKPRDDRGWRTGVPFPVTGALRKEFPHMVNASAIMSDFNIQVNIPTPDGAAQKKFKEQSGVFFAEPSFLQMFNFPLIQGSGKTALQDPNTVLLTKNLADKYFGDWTKAIGRSLIMDRLTVKVTGILDNPPVNTDFPITAIISYVSMEKIEDMNEWGGVSDHNYCFVQLQDNASTAQFDHLLAGFTEKHIKPFAPGYDLVLQSFKEIHSDGRLGTYTGYTFGKDLSFALSLIGLFLLIIACVNFINLTTAQAIRRAREVGVRKTLGSSRGQLIMQFLGETSITTLLALLASLVFVMIFLPFVNDLLETHMSLSQLYTIKTILLIFATLSGVSFLSGFYPALVLSGFKPVNVLKSAVTADRQKGISFRRGLVVFQFVIAQTLIIGTLIVASQMDYFRNADLGLKKDAIITASFPNDSLGLTKMDHLRNELYKTKGINDISFSAFVPSGISGWFTGLNLPANKTPVPDVIIEIKPADTSYFNVYDLRLVAGRRYFTADTMREIVVNEEVIRGLHIHDPEKAIGKIVNVAGSLVTIVGVVKDFHTNSLRDPINPLVLTPIKRTYSVVNVKIDLKNAKSVTAGMERLWEKSFPNYVFEYSFLDEYIAKYYKQENQLSQLYKVFAGIAIFISCLGLFGLISFMAVQKRKEIGVRKVLGAPVHQIVLMLSKEFALLIVIAFSIAAPLAWYFMHQWLQQYTYRISPGAGFFVATILCSLGIAWLTVGYTAIKAARANPVDSLRTE